MSNDMMRSRWGDRTSRTHYRFMRVSRDTGNEVGQLAMLKGGTVTRNNDVRIMSSAEVELVGRLDIGRDLVRIYLDAEWPDGTATSAPLGTFIPSVPSRSVKGRYSTATVKMSGRLQELLDDGFSTPVTIAPGTNAVQAAADVVRQQGLDVIVDESDFTVTRARTYGIGAVQNNSEVGDTKLDMVNDLLSLAGFRAAKDDPMGRVLLRKYSALEATAATWTFEEGPTAKFEREMTEERDSSSVANHVVCVYSNDERTIVGEATDDDPLSEFSTVSVGRVITKGYTFSEIPEGKSDTELQAIADNRARQYLKQNQSVVHRVVMRHVYAPVTVNDAVNLIYGTGGVSGKFEIRTQKISLTAGCPVETELRNWTRGDGL